MENKRNKLRSFMKQVQTSTEEILARRPSVTSPTSPSAAVVTSNVIPEASSQQLDLHSAIQFNDYLTSSYLSERDSRELPLYQQIIQEPGFSDQTVAECEQTIIGEIRADFFLEVNQEEESEEEDDSESELSNEQAGEATSEVDDVVDSISIAEPCDDGTLQMPPSITPTTPAPAPIQSDLDRSELPNDTPPLASSQLYTQSRVLEQCILSKLPTFDDTDSFLAWINEEKKRLTRQVTIVSKHLTDLITENDEHLKGELTRVHAIDESLKNAIGIVGNGRKSLFLSRRDFTSSSLSIIDNYHRRESIIAIIQSLQQIKCIRTTLEHIKALLELEKNFPCAIRLYHETSDTLERMATDYVCVQEMKARLVEMLLLAEEQMDQVLSKMPLTFCPTTYQQLSNAYQEIGKSEAAIQLLLMHFINTIHDKAFAIVLGYVELFSDLSSVTSSTPVKSRKAPGAVPASASSDLKRKPFTELCQYLNPDSFLSCLTDLCRAMWEIMQNYFRILCFYRSGERMKSTGLAEEEVLFARTKLEQGVLRIWSDVQHKIRTLVSSVKFAEMGGGTSADTSSDHTQNDQLYFTFEEFIKILTVSEKMLEIGTEFCGLYSGAQGTGEQSVTADLANMLYQQTRAYFQSYHHVSMAELKIFLENETWTRIPLERQDELRLIANLQEFSFIKNRLLKLRGTKPESANGATTASTANRKSLTSPKTSTSSSSFLLSPLTNTRHYFAAYFNADEDLDELELPKTGSPFDDILSLAINNTRVYDDPEEDDEVILESPGEPALPDGPEIATTNTALNVVRLTGRYMHIMYLLRPIAHDIIKALLELVDYYFFTVYRFFAVDARHSSWLSTCISSLTAASSLGATMDQPPVSSLQSRTTQQLQGHFSQISSELRSFVRRINDTLILNESQSANHSNLNSSLVHSSSAASMRDLPETTTSQAGSPNGSPKRLVKYPPPSLPDYVPINEPASLFALTERIMAIESLIFIARQFYNLCPFLLDILRTDNSVKDSETENEDGKRPTEDGFKLLQFYHDEMCSSVESLISQCLFAVSTKLLPYESIIASMGSTKWDLKEIPSMQSTYVDVFIGEIRAFNEQYSLLLASSDLTWLLPGKGRPSCITNGSTTAPDEASTLAASPLEKLTLISGRINALLWECLTRVVNRCFVEGFASAKKCTNEGRALMQLDYQQFLSHLERIISDYLGPSSSLDGPSPGTSTKLAKALLTAEKEFVEEYVKAYYLTEAIFLDWIRQRSEYTSKQVLSLVACIAGDNRKLKASLLAAIDSNNTGNAANTSLDGNSSNANLSLG